MLAAGNAAGLSDRSATSASSHLPALTRAASSRCWHLAREAGALALGRVALDGTKIKANASRHKAISYDRMPEEERRD